MSTSSTPVIVRRPLWPWAVLALGLAWTGVIRIPMVVNAVDHLDGDLAVDGLTLLDMVHGRFRWHFPGTPYMGIAPILAAYPQALAWGATPWALVSGGTVIWLLVVASTFLLMRRAFGPQAACWGIVPLVCSSLGTLWLSSRITGGHLMTLAWHNLALLGLVGCVRGGGWRSAAGLGVWCGLGLYLDPMFLITPAGLAPAALLAWGGGSRSRKGLVLAAAFGVGLALGVAPREIGRRVDPYNCYPSQFELTLTPALVFEHLRLLVFQCLPRLISGMPLNGLGELASRPHEAPARIMTLVAGQGPPRGTPFSVGAEAASVALLSFFALCLYRLLREAVRPRDPASAAASRAALIPALILVPAFLLNKNVYNSDNYRYLVYFLTPWSIGFGLWFRDLAGRGTARLLVALALASIYIEVMSSGVFHWYRDARGYIDERGRPSVVDHRPWTELDLETYQGDSSSRRLSRPYSIPPDATHLMGSYWDVYRLAFLSGGKVAGAPYPIYPNRFPGWSRGLGVGRGILVVFAPSPAPDAGVAATISGEARPWDERVVSGSMFAWRRALVTLWIGEGRDPAELGRLSVEVP